MPGGGWARYRAAVSRGELRRRLRRLLRRPRWGNLRRLEPFSTQWGWDRGHPIDRWYIDRFLERHGDDVRGAVLEVKDTSYTDRFGGAAVAERHVVDIDPGNARATFYADLCEPGSLPVDRFDCVLLTQTLHLLRDPAAALVNVRRALRPGGVLLLTSPVIAKVGHRPADGVDRWRLHGSALEELLAEHFPADEVRVSAFGNLVTAVAALYGLAVEDLTASDLEPHDASYTVIIGARARRP